MFPVKNSILKLFLAALKLHYKVMKIDKVKSCTMTAGEKLSCTDGRLWITADNQDIILEAGETLTLEKKRQRVVINLLQNNSSVKIDGRPSFFEKLPLFHKQVRLTGSFAG